MQRPQAVIFDMDGLIIDSEPLWRIAEIKGFAHYGMPITEEECALTMGWRIDEVVAFWKNKRPWKEGSVEDVVQTILGVLEEEIMQQGTFLPGVEALISFLQTHKVPIALASSSPMRIIQKVLEKLQLQGCFSVVESAEFQEFGKPHPAIFIETAEKLGVNTWECTVLEDSVNGVIAAKAAKMNCVAIPAAHELTRKEFGIANQIMANAQDLLTAWQG